MKKRCNVSSVLRCHFFAVCRIGHLMSPGFSQHVAGGLFLFFRFDRIISLEYPKWKANLAGRARRVGELSRGINRTTCLAMFGEK